jgi:hypothetical protein
MLFKRFKNVLLIAVLSLVIFSCKKDDDDVRLVPPNDLTEQYAVDIVKIEDYLKTHYMVLDDDLNVTILKIPTGGNQTSIWDQTDYPLVKDFEVKNDSRVSYSKGGLVEDPVTYKLYYIILNEGGGQRPTTIDSMFVDYRGWNFDNEEFDRTSSPLWTSFPAPNIQFISGFRQFVPKIKTAETVIENTDGTFSHLNFGNGVVFIKYEMSYIKIIP